MMILKGSKKRLRPQETSFQKKRERKTIFLAAYSGRLQKSSYSKMNPGINYSWSV